MSPTLLPLIGSPRHGARSSTTCHYRCNNACDAPVPNESDNPRLRDLVEGALARRSVLTGGAVGAGALVLAGLGAATPAAAASNASNALSAKEARTTPNLGRAAFTPVAPNRADAVTNAPGFTHNVVIRWGDPVEAGAPRFDVEAQTPEAQAKQFGYNNDYVGVLPLRGRQALLVTNHEYTDENLMFPAGAYDDTDDQEDRDGRPRHGRRGPSSAAATTGSWVRADHRPGRAQPPHHRAAPPSPVEGPAAGHELAAAPPRTPSGPPVLGTFEQLRRWHDTRGARCSPARRTSTATSTRVARSTPSQHDVLQALRPRDHHRDQPWLVRASTSASTSPKHPHEALPLRLDRRDRPPTAGSRPPIKNTMLGRFKHEGANVSLSRERSRRRLPGRRRARRLPLQVRLGRQPSARGGDRGRRAPTTRSLLDPAAPSMSPRFSGDGHR